VWKEKKPPTYPSCILAPSFLFQIHAPSTDSDYTTITRNTDWALRTPKQLKTHQGINMHWIQIRTKDISDSAFEYFLSIQSSWQLTLSLSVTVICHLSKALWTNRALNPFFICPSPFSGKCLYIDQKLFTSNIMQSSFKKYPRETVNTILCNLPKIDCSLSNCTC